MLCLSGFELYSRWVPLTQVTDRNHPFTGCMKVFQFTRSVGIVE